MVENLRAYFILYVITIKCIERMQEKIEFSCMLQRPRLISTKILGDFSVAFSTPCHPMATGLAKSRAQKFKLSSTVRLGKIV